MKKVSIAVAKQNRNFSQQKLTIGLDLGDRNSWYCVMDEAGHIQLEQRVSTTAKALREVFGAMPREAAISALLRLRRSVRTIQKEGYNLLEHLLTHIHGTV